MAGPDVPVHRQPCARPPGGDPGPTADRGLAHGQCHPGPGDRRGGGGEVRPSRHADGHGRCRHRAVDAASTSSMPPTRAGRTATGSCCPPATARCCSTRCSTSPATTAWGSRRSSASASSIRQPPAIRNTASTLAIETTTGPLGQGIATAVGMAIAERLLAARFGRSLVDHRTWVIASDGDMMEGISHEAAAHRRPSLPVEADRPLRRQPYLDRWQHRTLLLGRCAEALFGLRLGGAADRRPRPQQINAALSFATRSKKPTLIACRTIIGLGAPTKAGTAATHGSPLGGQEAAAAKAALGWHEPLFTVPNDLLERWRAVGSRGAATVAPGSSVSPTTACRRSSSG